MGKNKLLLFLAIIISLIVLIGIFFLLKNSNDEKSKGPLETTLYINGNEVKNGSFGMTGSSFYLYGKIENVQKQKERVWLNLSTELAGKPFNFKLILYDDNFKFPPFILVSTKTEVSQHTPKQTTKVLNNPQQIYNEIKGLEKNLVETRYSLNSEFYNESISECNKKLLKLLNLKSGNLNCPAYSRVIIMYEK